MEEPASALESAVERFRALFGRGELLSGAGRLLLGVSGGPDSTALACLLQDVLRLPEASRGELALPSEIMVGHVHHGLRGAEADEDEAFVRELARELGFRFVVERVDVSRAAAEEEGLSIEVAARRLRYDAFRRWAAELELDAIALAHTRDDQRETVLLRIARGTGLRGLAGMSPERRLEGCDRVRILRPLLGWKKAELVRYLEARGQPFREDESNRRLDIPRNRVRREILPRLAAVHPGVGPSLERLARLAGRLALDLEALGGRALDEALVSRAGGEVVVDAARLGRWPPSVVREALVRALEAIDPGSPPLPERACERFLALLRRDRDEPAGSVDLGRGAVAELRYGEVSIRRAESSDEEGAELALEIDGGAVCWKGWRVEAKRLPWPGETADRGEEWVDEESIAAGLTVRGRREGDVFHPLGAPGRKKLKEFFRERRIAPRFRDERPLVTVGDEVVWVVGERLGEPFRVRPRSRSTVRLRARRE